MKKLKTAVAKAAAHAAAAKGQVRLAKVQLKQARKLFKAAKKAAKQARRQLDAVESARAPRPAATLKLKPAIRNAPKAAKSKASAPRVAAKRILKKTVPRRISKARAPKAPQMRSAAEIAKTVIERLHAPPPILPPAPIIPPETSPTSDASKPATPASS